MKKNIWDKIIIILVALFLVLPTKVGATVNTKFYFDKESVITKVNNKFTLKLKGLDISDLYGFEVALSYDENQVTLEGKPSIIAIKGFSVGPVRADDDKVYFGCTQIGTKSGINGNLELGELTFRAKAAGSYDITLESITLVNSKMNMIKYEIGESVRVESETVKDMSTKLTDIVGHWAEDSIRKVINAGYMKGKTESTFCPTDNLTRGEIAVILDRIVDTKGSNESSFNDIIGNEWYAQSISNMSSQGLIKGYGDQTFRPKNSITRAEVVVILARLSQDRTYNGEKSLNDYKDGKQVSEWAKEDVVWAINKGLIKGNNNNELNMNKNMSRAEFAEILCRLLVW